MSMDYDSYLWAAIPAMTLMLIIYLFGLFGNVMWVLVTFRTKSLSSTCNYLLAFESIASSVHVTAHWYLAYLIYSGINAAPLQLCAYVMTIPIIGLCVGNVFILMIAVDRLAMVVAPMQYHKINQNFYLTISCLLGFAFAAYTLVISHINAAKTPDTKVVCIIVGAMTGTPYGIYSTISLCMNIATFVCYAIIIIVLKLSQQKTDKLFKPLMIMIMIVLFSWVLSSICLTLVSQTNNDVWIFYTPMYAGLGVNVSCACNFYVLYFMSSEYRQHFKNLFAKMCGGTTHSTTVSVMSVSNHKHRAVTR
uniref:G_PROTEIN_RECEP_F1_2 domain-containing protein n=1 Tax=Panagrellus redivivus TaxID=6233 RepID=A0A7E4UZ76_PANRE